MTIKIIVSFVILKSIPPKYKGIKGKITNCSKGLKKKTSCHKNIKILKILATPPVNNYK